MDLAPANTIATPAAQGPDTTEAGLFAQPVIVESPSRQRIPFVFSSPHSGRHYPASFVAASNLDALTLRRSEDSFVEALFAGAVGLGAPLLHALFPRAYLDANREPYELDPSMFAEPLPPHVNTRSLRVAGGLGTIARVVSDATEIYREPLSYAEAEERIRRLYMPFHDALKGLLEDTLKSFGCAILIDCHSMPSVGGPTDDDNGADRPDIVLGDRYGTSCAGAITAEAERILRQLGYSVVRNNPYAGGFNTEHYGRPRRGLHALQIEVNRALYMDEARLEPTPGLEKMQADMTAFIDELAAWDWSALTPGARGAAF
ncbi:MAG: N-formylglutamate amidohydrolase [Parvibaculum sp.]|uniref:N-formylglutamate amidohydrolase n=1 Tax=Parvibaculum sp. TaxID=2024848 RepID=UPI001D2F1D50|nr:N-formylglutamate amidohydrolase [Parvibaculum sp.]MBX3489102.1 N-formylglutamate amidohydrolase [Parvibaculum sp.]MBX3497018.1 N-formylglutamate amidohydrolase [Parvibaculum sp.]MCW5727029.1 N-formylglutamate amidohydrolase [Parvibaculum sp.]